MKNATTKKGLARKTAGVISVALAAVFMVSGCVVSGEKVQSPSTSEALVQQLSIMEKSNEETVFSSWKNLCVVAPDGDELTLEDATFIDFPCAYITYCEAGASWDPEAVPLKIREGDVLDNGLEVIRAYTSVSIHDGEYELTETEANFKGELTMIGTLRCDQEADPIDGEVGDLYFIPDSDQDIMLPFQLHNSGKYKLGNIRDEGLPEGIMDIVNDDGKETAKVEATIKYIRVFSAFASSGRRDLATLVSVKKI